MLGRLISKTSRNLVAIRELQIGNNVLNVPKVETKSRPVSRSHVPKYVFKQITNESVIKDFCSVKLNPKLLKMPDSDTPDDVVHSLLHKLTAMDLSNYATGKENLKKLGIFGSLIPKQYGGLGLSSSQFSYLLQNEKLIDWALMLIAHQNLCAQTIIQYGSEEQKSIYLPKLASGELLGAFCLNEKSSGNDIFSMETEAVLTGLEDNYVLQGTKTWVINGYSANLFIVFTMSQDSKYEGGRNHVTGLIVDRTSEGVSVGNSYNIDWLNNCEVSDVSFKNVFVPVSNVLFEDHGGYKIANHIQNNARFIVAVCMSGIIRILVSDLISKESCGLIAQDNSLIHHLMNDCIAYLYAIESSLYFTTRFADKYLVPEIELESASVKVFSSETALQVVDNYQKILHLIGQPIRKDIEILCRRVHGLQNFMGSNYFTKLYIGGTMMQLSVIDWKEMREKIRSPLKNIPWMKDVLKDALHPIHWTDNMSEANYISTLKYNIFIKDLEKIFRSLQVSRISLLSTYKRLQNDALEFQFIMEAMAHLGEMVYILICCVARANTNFGDFEVKCTKNILEKTYVVIDQSLSALDDAVKKPFDSLLINLSEDMQIANGYPPLDVLEMRRHLGNQPKH